jgi:hypothetical protein
MWELLENRVYNKPNGCSAPGALAACPEHHHQQQQQPKKDKGFSIKNRVNIDKKDESLCK